MEDQIDNEFLDENPENQDLESCDLCNRKFHPERIERHLIACQKAQQKQQERDKIIQKKKKQIEQKKQQLQQMDVEIIKTNWREEHQKFQEQIQYNRKLKQLETEGQDVNQLKPLETKVNSNYVFCEYCERHFDKHVAERHIPKCKEIIAKPKPPRKKTVEMIQPSQPSLQEKRQAQVSTPSTSSQMERKPIIKKQLSDSSQQFRPTSLQKFIAEQSGKANLTNIGFIDCKARATAIQDTECPHCNRRFISKAAERHIPICEKLTRKHSFRITIEVLDEQFPISYQYQYFLFIYCKYKQFNKFSLFNQQLRNQISKQKERSHQTKQFNDVDSYSYVTLDLKKNQQVIRNRNFASNWKQLKILYRMWKQILGKSQILRWMWTQKRT